MSHYSSPLWGEIPQVDDTDSGIAALEREQITKPRKMEIEGPPLHQPSSRHHPPTNESLPSKHFEIDPVVLHTIRLLKHIRRLRAAIDGLQNDVKPEKDCGLTTVGPMPDYDGPERKDRCKQKYFTEEEYKTEFVQGLQASSPPIDDTTCRKLLRRSTCAIIAHLNFDGARESIVDSMTDLCHQFLIQFTRHMGAAADRRAQYGSSGFPDVVEQTFHELGLGSMTSLHDFYQQRILAYHSKTVEQCRTLMQEYTTLKQQQQQIAERNADPNDTDTLHVIRIKEEPSTDIQFPLLDENSDMTDAEQLLNIESLGSFEITVEHETATGLTTEVDTKWSGGGKVADSKSRHGYSSVTPATTPSEETAGAFPTDNPSSVTGIRTPQSNSVPRTPQSNIPPTTPQAPTPGNVHGATEDSTIQEPGSISSMDIFSPLAVTPSMPKKKKKN